MLKDFPKHRDVAKAAARKKDDLQKKNSINSVHLVLAKLCQKMDDKEVLESEKDDDL